MVVISSLSNQRPTVHQALTLYTYGQPAPSSRLGVFVGLRSFDVALFKQHFSSNAVVGGVLTVSDRVRLLVGTVVGPAISGANRYGMFAECGYAIFGREIPVSIVAQADHQPTGGRVQISVGVAVGIRAEFLRL